MSFCLQIRAGEVVISILILQTMKIKLKGQIIPGKSDPN